MTTKIPVELSSTPGIVDGSNATAITIDSSERVGIGTTNPSQKLETTGNIFINAPSGNPDLTIKTAGVGNNPFVAYRAGDNLVFDNMAVFSASTDYWRVAYGSSGSVTTELLAVTSAGNVGIGTVTPSQKLHVVGKIKCTDDLIIGGTSPRIDYDGGSTGSLRFFSTSANTERMRIESGGNVGIGTTSPSRLLEVQLTATNASLHNNNTAAVHFGSGSGNANSDGYIQGISIGYKTSGANTYAKTAIVARGLNDGAARQSMAFLVDTAADGGSAEIGDAKLTINGTTGVVSGDLNDTSDIAFKENILDLGNTLDLVKQLQPKTFTWKNEKAERGDSVGFIAQDVKSIIPDSTVVQGTAYEKNGDEGYSINTIGLVAYLTKAIQEQQEQIEQLKTEIQTLKGE